MTNSLKYNSPKDLPNQAGFKFTGIDKFGHFHDCEIVAVRKTYDNGNEGVTYKVKSEFVVYSDLIGWLK